MPNYPLMCFLLAMGLMIAWYKTACHLMWKYEQPEWSFKSETKWAARLLLIAPAAFGFLYGLFLLFKATR